MESTSAKKMNSVTGKKRTRRFRNRSPRRPATVARQGSCVIWVMLLILAMLGLSLSTLIHGVSPAAAQRIFTEVPPPSLTPTLPVISTATPIASATPTATSTATPTATPTEPVILTEIPTATLPGPITPSATLAATPTASGTPEATPTTLATPVAISTATATPSGTFKLKPTATPVRIDLEGEYVSDQVLVRFRRMFDPRSMVAIIADIPGTQVDMRKALGSLDVWSLRVRVGSVSHVIEDLRSNPLVEFAEPNYIARVYLVPDDPYWVKQSYLFNIQAPQAWEVTTGASEVIIAAVDTGLDTTHPDLAARIWNNHGEVGFDPAGHDKRTNGLDDDGNGYIDDWMGWNTVSGTGDVQDDHGHGTHVAGIAAADTDNGQGIAGVAWDARIMPVKALNSAGFGTYLQVAEGIMYAAEQGAQVINLSFGSSQPSAVLEAAVNDARSRGALVVAAAGNSGSSVANYPAAYRSVISVGATDADDQLASFSTFGATMDLVAPGVDIYSTYAGGGYTQYYGTSLAAAHVSGVAALLFSLPQFNTPAQVQDALLATALDLGDPGWDPNYGSGLVQAYDALNHDPAGLPTPTPSLTPGPTPTVTPGATPTPADGVRILATPVAPTPAPTDVPGADDPHVDYHATTSSCAGCHRSHTAGGIVLRQTRPEENVCFGCHTGGGPGTDVQPAFAPTNTATRFFKHDVATTEGVHQVGETGGADYGGPNRHVECEDCHEPHEATRGPAIAPMLQREMNSISGVDPMWTAPGPPDPALFTWLPQAEREYQVCFKCHSSFTALPGYLPDGWDGTQYVPDGLRKLTSADPVQVPDSRDLAQEFNPFNTSFHPVVAVGQNPSIPAASFVPGWSSASMVYCTDCHMNGGVGSAGPHGSPRLHLLDGQQDYTTVMTGIAPAAQDQELCFKCHDAATYLNTTNVGNTNFYRTTGNRNLHGTHMTRSNGRAATCYSCHDTHGSEQEHLLNFEVDPGTLDLWPGYDSQSAWHDYSVTQKECALTCHGRSHSTSSFRYP